MSRINIKVHNKTLVVNLPETCQVLSWAPFNPGPTQTRCIFNHQLDEGMKEKLSDIFKNLQKDIGLPENAVGLLTSAEVEKYSTRYMLSSRHWVETVCTVGLDNSRTAGEAADVKKTDEKNPYGTINIILATNALPHVSGQLEAIQVATMAKTRALFDMGVKSRKSGTPATGTGTDCIVLASSGEVKQNFCGMHTRLGELIGQTVYEAVKEGIKNSL